MTPILWGLVIGWGSAFAVLAGHVLWLMFVVVAPCPICKTPFDPTRPCGLLPVRGQRNTFSAICPRCTAERQTVLERDYGSIRPSPGSCFVYNRSGGRRARHYFPMEVRP